MNENVKVFRLCSNHRMLLSRMSAEQKAELLDSLFAYNDGEEVAIDDPLVDTVFMVMTEDMERMRKFAEQKKANGRKGGRPQSNNQSKPNITKANQEKPSETKINQAITKNNQGETKANQEKPQHQHQHEELINTPLLPKGSIPPRGETHTKKPKEAKLPFGELGNVLLTAREREKLDERFGFEGAQERIDSLDAYIGSKGAKYDSHYATILNWERMDDKRRQTAATVPRAAPVATTVAQQRSLERQVMAEMLLEDRKQREEAKYDANGSRIVTQPDGSQLALPPGW